MVGDAARRGHCHGVLSGGSLFSSHYIFGRKGDAAFEELAMTMRTIILCFMLSYTLQLVARDKTDVLIMKNGDRMTCEVKGLDAGVLYVSFDYVDGTASVDWSKVADLESKQLFIVTTQDGTVYMGMLRTPETASGRPVKIEVVREPDQEVAINREQVVRMIETSPSFWRRFSGELSFGTIYSKGNQSTQYSLGSQTAYIRERWRAYANLESSLSSSTGSTVSTRNLLNFGASHLLPWNQWFYSGLGGFLQSSEQGITLQSTAGGGVGRYLKNTDRVSISLLGGGAWQNTHYKTTAVPLGKQNIASALLYSEVRFFKFSRTNLNVTAALLPAISDPGHVRFNTDASYYIKLFSNLKWNISFYGNWDNRPPPGFSGSDYGTSSGVSWTFGLK